MLNKYKTIHHALKGAHSLFHLNINHLNFLNCTHIYIAYKS